MTQGGVVHRKKERNLMGSCGTDKIISNILPEIYRTFVAPMQRSRRLRIVSRMGPAKPST